MCVIQIIGFILIALDQTFSGYEEHVIATYARIHERRFPFSLTTRDKRDTAAGLHAVGHTREHAIAHPQRLELVYVPRSIRIPGHKRIRAVEEQATTVRQIARLVQ